MPIDTANERLIINYITLRWWIPPGILETWKWLAENQPARHIGPYLISLGAAYTLPLQSTVAHKLRGIFWQACRICLMSPLWKVHGCVKNRQKIWHRAMASVHWISHVNELEGDGSEASYRFPFSICPKSLWKQEAAGIPMQLLAGLGLLVSRAFLNPCAGPCRPLPTSIQLTWLASPHSTSDNPDDFHRQIAFRTTKKVESNQLFLHWGTI